jgi:hypothetical protein
MSLASGIISWVNSIEWTPEAITATATIALAFLTLILAFGTIGANCAHTSAQNRAF